jgi:hypothetical protein
MEPLGSLEPKAAGESLTPLVLLAGFLVLVLVGLGAGYWWTISRQPELPAVAREEQVAEPRTDYIPEYVFESRIPGLTVSPAEGAAELVESWLERYRYPHPRQFGAWVEGTHHVVQPKTVAFVFYPMENLEESEQAGLLFPVRSGEQVMGGVLYGLDEERVEYRVYVNEYYHSKSEASEVAKHMTWLLVRALFAGVPAGQVNPDISSVIWQEVFDRQQWVVMVSRELSWGRRVLAWLVPPVQAQCSGLVECGAITTDLFCENKVKCDDPDLTCEDQGIPGGSGACYEQTGCFQFPGPGCFNCGAVPGPPHCYDQTTQATCGGLTCPLSAPYCTYQYCYWPGGGGPTPVPTPPGCTCNCGPTYINACDATRNGESRLRGRYYNGSSQLKYIDYDQPLNQTNWDVTAKGESGRPICHQWSEIRWDGDIRAPTSGTYWFRYSFQDFGGNDRD